MQMQTILDMKTHWPLFSLQQASLMFLQVPAFLHPVQVDGVIVGLTETGTWGYMIDLYALHTAK